MATWRNVFFSPVRECGTWDVGTGTGVCNLTYCEEIASHGSWQYCASFATKFPKTQHRGKEARHDICDSSRFQSLNSSYRCTGIVPKSLVLSHGFFLTCRNSIESPGGAQAIHLEEALSWRLRVCQVLATFASNHKASGIPSPSGHADLPPALVRAPSLPRECGWTQVTLLGSRRVPGTWGLI